MSDLLKRVDTELEIAKSLNPVMAMGMIAIRKMIVEESQGESISLRRINGLKPTLLSCTMKVFEEIGEVMQCLGKGQGMSGEKTELDHANWVFKTISEALDGMQALNTLIYVLADENNVDVQGEVGRHEAKLVKKGYLVDGGTEL